MVSSAGSASGVWQPSDRSSVDPFLHFLRLLTASSACRAHSPEASRVLALPSPVTVFSLVLLTHFAVVSGLVYDVIVSTQDRYAGTLHHRRPLLLVNVRLGCVGLILMDLALDRNCTRSVRLSFTSFGILAVITSYIMCILFIRIQISVYLSG